MKTEAKEIGRIITGMREAYHRGENAMEWARVNSSVSENSVVNTLVAYDLQAGSYVKQATENPEFSKKWSIQLADLLRPYLDAGDSILEVGVGEATTLSGVVDSFKKIEISPFGLDVSWSRIKVAQQWLVANKLDGRLFVGDLFRIPLADNAIDVVYTSHSLEPNGGREKAALNELIRVARKAVVLIEPLYELASEEAQQRMQFHGYVQGLKISAEILGANVVEYGLLDLCSNPLNPSGVLLIEKSAEQTDNSFWQCPLTETAITEHDEFFYADKVGIGYPVLRGVPLLRAEHSVIASNLQHELEPS